MAANYFTATAPKDIKVSKAEKAREEFKFLISSFSEEARKEFLAALKYALTLTGEAIKVKLNERMDAYMARQVAS